MPDGVSRVGPPSHVCEILDVRCSNISIRKTVHLDTLGRERHKRKLLIIIRRASIQSLNNLFREKNFVFEVLTANVVAERGRVCFRTGTIEALEGFMGRTDGT